jgi:hypothetical protein
MPLDDKRRRYIPELHPFIELVLVLLVALVLLAAFKWM